MISIYHPKFMCWEWDEYIDGKSAIVTDCACFVEKFLEEGVNDGVIEGVVREGNKRLPFMVDSVNYRFCYFDPLMEYKRAYNNGKDVYFKLFESDDWFLIDKDDFAWSDNYEYIIREKSHKITERQLAMWLASGKGEYKIKNNNSNFVRQYYWYSEEHGDEKVANILVRRWSDSKWSEPTVEYCFPEVTA